MDIDKLEENLKYALDDYGNELAKKDLLALEKNRILQSILTPEQLAEIEALDFEFAGKEKQVEEDAKKKRKLLDAYLRQYTESLYLGKNEKKIVKGRLAKVSVEEGDVVYDPTFMDGYAMSHPEVLSARQEGKKKTRVTLINNVEYERG